MIDNYKRMRVYRVSRTRDLYSKRTRIYNYTDQSRGGRVYEIKTLRSNLAPEEGGATTKYSQTFECYCSQ